MKCIHPKTMATTPAMTCKFDELYLLITGSLQYQSIYIYIIIIIIIIIQYQTSKTVHVLMGSTAPSAIRIFIGLPHQPYRLRSSKPPPLGWGEQQNNNDVLSWTKRYTRAD